MVEVSERKVEVTAPDVSRLSTVPMDMALARNRTGKISAGMSHVTGPRPSEKKTKKEKKAVYERPMMGGVVESEKASIPSDATMPAEE
eukprot:scaffold99400_cov55-Phaeocystis_antarctica.AAC.4